MANTDRPNGFRFVKTTNGVATAQVRALGVTAADIFKGDVIELSSGLAKASVTNSAAILGVAVGFGKRDPSTGSIGSMMDPDNLNIQYFDTSNMTNTDYVVFYIPAQGNIFEAQTNAAVTAVVGGAYDILPTTGDTTTGNSAMEINTTNANSDLVVIEVPDLPDNDNKLVWGRYYVQFTAAELAFA